MTRKPKTKKIWLVQGSSGQYSDWRCWIVCAFTDEQKAKSMVEAIGAEYRLFKTKWPKPNYMYGDDEKYKAEISASTDPSNFGGWDGPNYTAFETELRS